MQRYANKSILRVLWRPSWISSKYYCYTCKKKWNPIFFLSRSYSEPESVAKSILTNKKAKLQMDLHYLCNFDRGSSTYGDGIHSKNERLQL